MLQFFSIFVKIKKLFGKQKNSNKFLKTISNVEKVKSADDPEEMPTGDAKGEYWSALYTVLLAPTVKINGL